MHAPRVKEQFTLWGNSNLEIAEGNSFHRIVQNYSNQLRYGRVMCYDQQYSVTFPFLCIQYQNLPQCDRSAGREGQGWSTLVHSTA